VTATGHGDGTAAGCPVLPTLGLAVSRDDELHRGVSAQLRPMFLATPLEGAHRGAMFGQLGPCRQGHQWHLLLGGGEGGGGGGSGFGFFL
jgi:hypothetical protein